MLQSNEFWSAVVGAIVGGAIAALLQWMSIKTERNQKRQEFLRDQQALGCALIFKMMRIHSDFHQIHEHFEQCITSASEQGINGELWQVITPLANPPDPIHFTSAEMSLVLAQGDHDVFNVTIDQDVRHNGLVEALKVLNAKRLELGERFAEVAAIDVENGPRIGGLVSSRDIQKLRPRMIEVNSLAEGVRKQAKENASESLGALRQLHQLFRKSLSLPFNIQI